MFLKINIFLHHHKIVTFGLFMYIGILRIWSIIRSVRIWYLYTLPTIAVYNLNFGSCDLKIFWGLLFYEARETDILDVVSLNVFYYNIYKHPEFHKFNFIYAKNIYSITSQKFHSTFFSQHSLKVFVANMKKDVKDIKYMKVGYLT